MSNSRCRFGTKRLFLGLLAASLAGLAFGQVRPVVDPVNPMSSQALKPGESRAMKPWDKPLKIGRVNPKKFFPKVAKAVGARGIRPSNPSIKLKESGYKLDRSLDGVDLPAVGGNTAATNTLLNSRFPGIGFTGWFPPDTHMAVGSTHVVQVTNVSVGFFNKNTGALEFQQTLDGAGFFAGQNVGTFTFDPRVIYDADSNRFIIIVLDVDFNTNTSRVQIAISDNDDPFNPWTLVTLNNTITIGGAPLWGDYPTIALNEDYYVLSFNHFGFITNDVIGSIFAISRDLSNVEFFDAGQFSVSMAKRSTPGTKGPVYGVGIVAPFLGAPAAANVFSIHKFGRQAVISNQQVQLPIFMPQGAGASMRGVFIDTLGDRMMDASVTNNSLVFALTVNAGPDNLGFQYPFSVSPTPNRSKVRWGEIMLNDFPKGVPKLFQSGDMGYANTFSTLVPAIIKNASGEIAVVATRTSAGETPKVVAATRRSIDEKGTLGPIALFGSSANFNVAGGSTSRWGDYAGIGIDPADPKRFWGSHELFTNANLEWTTEIFSFIVGSSSAVSSEATAVVPIFGTVNAGDIDSFDDLNDGDQYILDSEAQASRGNYAGYELTFNPGGTVNNADITLNMSASTDGVSAFVYVFNNVTSQWDSLWSIRLKTTGQEAVIVLDSARMAKYIDGSGNIRVRAVASIAERRRGVLPPPFQFRTDFGSVMVNRN